MILAILIALAAGIAIGSVAHATLAKEETATKAELSGWAERLRSAFDADAATAKATVKTLILDIEKKI